MVRCQTGCCTQPECIDLERCSLTAFEGCKLEEASGGVMSARRHCKGCMFVWCQIAGLQLYAKKLSRDDVSAMVQQTSSCDYQAKHGVLQVSAWAYLTGRGVALPRPHIQLHGLQPLHIATLLTGLQILLFVLHSLTPQSQ